MEKYVEIINGAIEQYRKKVADLMDENFWGMASMQALQLAIGFRIIAQDVINDLGSSDLSDIALGLCIKINTLGCFLKENCDINGMKKDRGSSEETLKYRQETDTAVAECCSKMKKMMTT